MTFHEKLSMLTEERNKSALCRRAGLPICTISNYIAKKQTPGGDVALRLARVFGVDVSWLLDDAESWPPMRVTKRVVAAAYAA